VRKWRVPSQPKKRRGKNVPAPAWRLDAARLARFRKALLAWFARKKRDLPWRATRDPYRVWVSEIMLQQTRVAAVIPYYERFLAQFPDVAVLASAPIERVLQYWAGLGYYSRARNLQAAAKQICAQHRGEFPRERDEALALSGIGSYTAAAVLSIAYDVPLAVLDGNVARVLARLGAIRGDLRAPKRWAELSEAAQMMLAPRAAGDWNQAMMELGAMVCSPRAPDCEACPVASFCEAQMLGIADELPAKKVKRATEHITLAAAVLVDARERTLLLSPSKNGARVAPTDGEQPKSAQALFSNLWQFPAVRTRNGEASAALATLVKHLRETLGIGADSPWQQFEATSHARHTVTYRNIVLAPYLLRVEKLPHVARARAVPLRSLGGLAVSSATRKIAASALRSL
jgi:A/G-specific adenine glycosylase